MEGMLNAGRGATGLKKNIGIEAKKAGLKYHLEVNNLQCTMKTTFNSSAIMKFRKFKVFAGPVYLISTYN